MKRFWSDEGGATSIEYALIGMLIALVIIGGVATIGQNLKTPLNSVGSGLALSR